MASRGLTMTTEMILTKTLPSPSKTMPCNPVTTIASAKVGVGALLELVRGRVGVTPDGPKGPLRSVQPGVVRLAIKTGAPIIPTT